MRGQKLYKCRDCEARKFVTTITANRAGGLRCMECGGVLDAESVNAVSQEQRAYEGAMSRKDGQGSIKLFKGGRKWGV